MFFSHLCRPFSPLQPFQPSEQLIPPAYQPSTCDATYFDTKPGNIKSILHPQQSNASLSGLSPSSLSFLRAYETYMLQLDNIRVLIGRFDVLVRSGAWAHNNLHSRFPLPCDIKSPVGAFESGVELMEGMANSKVVTGSYCQNNESG
ncbi:unnamed protein product [Protopolystoma xenopodis]|uniref:Uncharacterized protein n=1 Tax=Protopolystoma xenopodis TaxID=117903 RepID=A0A3S5CLK2_9PLAT|nr:unnamed protein product [Protopolystoma xenopodis]